MDQSSNNAVSRRAAGGFALLAMLLWAIGSPGWCGPDLSALDDAIATGEYGPVTALLVQHRGELVHESYFQGSGPQELQQIFSITKSVAATLVGMAVRRGLLSVDETVENLLPQYDWESEELSAARHIRLEDILSMRLGLEWEELSIPYGHPANSFTSMMATDDWYRYTLSRFPVHEPGNRFAYNTGGSMVLGAILAAVTGRTPRELFADWLAAPLGITDFEWELFSFEGLGHGQRDFPFGEEPLGTGLWLTPGDLLKFGQLYLDGGAQEGRRLIDPEWLVDSWTAYSHGGNDPFFAALSVPYGYGYQWWYRNFLDSRDRQHHCWWAMGFRGQSLIVCPAMDLIVVSTRDARDYEFSGPGIGQMMGQHILPQLRYPVSAELSGFYFDPQTSGEGLNIEVSETLDMVYIIWNTYEQGEQRWYNMLGEIHDDQVVFDDIFRTTGGHFQSGLAVDYQWTGSASLYWESCNDARLSYDFELGHGEYRLQRLLPACTDAPLMAD